MSSRTALESVLSDAGVKRSHVRAIVWSLRAGGDTVPNEDHLADCLLRWKARAVRQALEAVGVDDIAQERADEPDGTLSLWPDHSSLQSPPPVQ